MSNDMGIHDSTGNVFEEMGMRDAEERLARTELARFSMNRLERLLNALDLEIRIQVGPRPSHKAHAGITVETVDSF